MALPVAKVNTGNVTKGREREAGVHGRRQGGRGGRVARRREKKRKEQDEEGKRMEIEKRKEEMNAGQHLH